VILKRTLSGLRTVVVNNSNSWTQKTFFKFLLRKQEINSKPKHAKPIAVIANLLSIII
jgi:hypothetical protein